MNQEQRIADLDGLNLAKIEKLIADFRKRHDKLMKRIDRQIEREQTFQPDVCL
jgi:hypothetical protein